MTVYLSKRGYISVGPWPQTESNWETNPGANSSAASTPTPPVRLFVAPVGSSREPISC